MEFKMSGELTVSLSCEKLETGSEEERATFGLFAMTANERLLTAGEDPCRKELRHGPHVSGYPIAEWIVWNWWRLRWEGKVGRPSDENAASRWDFAHRMSTIGEGYAWPNITIFSDGVYSFLISEPSRSPETTLFHYIGAERQRVPAENLKTAFDGFVNDILDRLEESKVRETNLHRLWNDLNEERENPGLARFRRLEAQLGFEPDEADEVAIRRHLDDATMLGEEALGEIAADATFDDDALNAMMSATDITNIGKQNGFEANSNDVIALDNAPDTPQPGQVEAWRLGELFAKEIRDQENLDGLPISNADLAGFAGSSSNVIAGKNGHSHKISFALDEESDHTLVYLRSKWETGRRFELARLIGDRIIRNQMSKTCERLFPATRASSYRQKMQRAFAAELLSPFAFVKERMDGDYSEDNQNEVANYFTVSPMTIQTQLVNHGLVDRDDAPEIVNRSPYP